MRTVIALGVMAIVLFGLAAGATIFLSHYLDEKNKAQHNETAGAADSGKEKEPPPLARTGEPAPRPRPGSNPDAEQLAQEFAKLRERQENVARQEQQLVRRQKNLDVIKEDIRGEREEIDKVRKELTEQVKGVGDDMAAAERRAADLERKKQETEELVKDAKRGVYEADQVRSGGIKRVGGIYDTAEPSDVARIFETMVESGDLMTAAQILANMRERRAAAVLAAMQDKATAAQLTEKMVGLKQAVPPAAAAPGSRAPRPAAPGDGTH
jgi:flagellar motility protein MotE (MotC chaperone)